MVKTRIFYASDVHGSELVFMKFVNAGRFYQANTVILGGDLTGKMIVPIVTLSGGTFMADFLGTRQFAKTEEELSALEKNIRFNGFYPYRANSNEISDLKSDQAKVDLLFSRLMVETLENWIRIAEQRLKGSGIQCFIMPGNDDQLSVDQAFKQSDYIIDPEGKVVDIDPNHEMISTGFANITPWKAPRDISEDELAEKIDRMASQVKNINNCIFNFHCPPFESGIDDAPKLVDLRPTQEPGGFQMAPAGSIAIRNAFERYQPLLGLHGHIHESRGSAKIGRTVCLNPGSNYSEGVLRGVVVNLTEKGVSNYSFTSG